MCIQLVRKVKEIQGDIALMDDGRKVRISMIADVKVGDLLDVYGDIALERVNDVNTKEYNSIKKGGI